MNYRVLCITDRSDLPESELFIRLHKAGVDIEIACNPTGRFHDRLVASGIPIHELTLKSRFSPRGIQSIRRILDAGSYDILYCFNNKATSNALLSLGGRNIKMMTYRGTVGNLSFFSPASWTTHLNPRVNRIICVSEAVRDHLIHMRKMGFRIRPERAVAIYKGHDLDWYRRPPADLLEFSILKDDFVVGFAGRNRPHKGAHVIVEATRHLPANLPIHFILMGRISENKQLRQQIEKSAYKEKIHLTGFRADAPAVTAACDAFVMPSTKREGLSRAVIEAMACGVAPIVTNVGGLPELVEQGKSGLVIPPDDPAALAGAVMDLFSHPEKKKAFGLAAQERIGTHFNIDRTVAETIKVFEELAGT